MPRECMSKRETETNEPLGTVDSPVSAVQAVKVANVGPFQVLLD